jgi:hypothetical protein
MMANASAVELAWSVVALLGVLLSGWACQDDHASFEAVRLAVRLKRAVTWGPRWWMALAFLVSDLLFALVWIGFGSIGVVAMALPEAISPERREANEMIGYVLLGLEGVLALIQVWWRVVRLKLRSQGAWAPAPSIERQRLRQVEGAGRPLIHAINGDLQFVVAALDLVSAGGGLSPSQLAELDGAIERLKTLGLHLGQLQTLVRGADGPGGEV